MKSVRIWRYAISALAVASLIVNIVLVFTLLRIGQGVQSAVASARASLEVARTEPVKLTVSIDQQVPISTTVPLEQVFVLPVQFDFPLSTEVNTYIDIPLLGRQQIEVPVEATIPISQTLTVPLDIAVPVNITPTLQMDVPVEIALPPAVIAALEDFVDGVEEGLRFGFR